MSELALHPRKGLLATAVAIAALATSPVFADGQRGADTAPPKTNATFGVLQFAAGSETVNESWYSSQFQIMNSFAEMMTTTLVENGYRLIERERLGDILKEQDLGKDGRVDAPTAAKLGKVIGVDYVILGTVTQFGVTKTGGGLGGVLGRITDVNVNQTKGDAAIDVRIVNSTTGEIVAVGKGSGSLSSTSFNLTFDWWKNVNFQNSEWESSMIGKAAKKAVDECIKKLDPKMSKLPSLGLTPAVPKARYTVLAVTSAGDAIVEMDPKTPLKVGDVLILRRITNVVKKDGKVIFEESTAVGKVEVVEVQENGAKVKLVAGSGDAIKEGDIAEP
jgi:curli biogenesis system outer membrane secretion channel CsgG